MWITSVCLIDEVHKVETKQHCEIIEETLDHQAKHQNTGIDTLYGLSHHRNSSQSNNSTSSSSTSDFIKVPPLLHSEQTLLNEHEGCTKCHCFYAGHHSQSCPKDSFSVKVTKWSCWQMPQPQRRGKLL